MKEQEMEQIFVQECDRENDMLEQEMLKEERHEFSAEHKRRMNKIFRECGKRKTSEDTSRENIVIAFQTRKRIRRVAAVFLAVCAVGVAGTVSAKMFGFNPWHIITSQIGGVQTTTYEKASEKEAMVSVRKCSNIPTRIPIGYKQRDRKDAKDDVVATWESQDGHEICYSQLKIVDGMVSEMDTSNSKKESVMIAKYKADVIYEGNEVRLDWNDEKYTYFLYSDGLTKEELQQTAQSIYKEQ